MQNVYLHALPEAAEDIWTVEHFCSKIDIICRSAADELHRKSLMVEEAVEEILKLVRKARIECPSSSVEEFFFEGKFTIRVFFSEIEEMYCEKRSAIFLCV